MNKRTDNGCPGGNRQELRPRNRKRALLRAAATPTILASLALASAAGATAQEPGDSVRVRLPADTAWRYGRILAANDEELVLGTPTALEVLQRRLIADVERFDPRRPEWVIGLWALGGLAAGTLVAALASEDATTEDRAPFGL